MKYILACLLSFILVACGSNPERIETIRYEQVPIVIPRDKLVVEPVPSPPTKEALTGKKPQEVYRVLGVYITELHQTIDRLNLRFKKLDEDQIEKLKAIEASNQKAKNGS